MNWEQASRKERQLRASLVRQADKMLDEPTVRKVRQGKTVTVHPNSTAARKWGRRSIKSYSK